MRRIREFCDHVLRPLLQRPKYVQVGALCYRSAGAKTQVLLITSRGTGRWIIPKGSLIRGKTAAESALEEAWEEAGVRAGITSDEPVGTFSHTKVLKGGLPVAVDILVFAVEVANLDNDYPERMQRQRRWFTLNAAAGLVAERDLQTIILNFDPRNHR